jgi:flagellar FlgO protein
MEREPGSPARSRALAKALVLVALALLVFGCATTGPKLAGTDVSQIAEQLVESARQRVELGQMRVVVRAIEELHPAPTGPRPAGNPVQRTDPISETLEHEFVIALAGQLNVLESELVEPPVSSTTPSTLSEMASSYGATHLLAGDYQRSGDKLVVSVRLIDAESKIIVAAARGTVALPAAERGRSGPFLAERQLESSAAVARVEPLQIPEEVATPAEATVSIPAPEAALVTRSSTAGGAPTAPAASSAPAAPLAAEPFEDFATWRKNREAQPGAEETVQPLPPSSAVPDFETWRKERLEKAAAESKRDESTAPPEKSPNPSASATGAKAPDSPWRTKELAERLRIPPEELFPWRKDPVLTELLGIPPAVTPRKPR